MKKILPILFCICIFNTSYAQNNYTKSDDAARIVAASDPTELFGGASEKWASLAFAPKINR